MALALLSKTRHVGPSMASCARKIKPGVVRSHIDSQSRLDGLATGPRVATALRPPVIQAKLKIGEPNDKFEQEAERVADEVMGMPGNAPFDSSAAVGHEIPGQLPGTEPLSIQRLCSDCSIQQDEELQSNSATKPIRVSRLHSPTAARLAFPDQSSVLQRQELGEEADEEEEAVQPKLHDGAMQREDLGEEEETVRAHQTGDTATANATLGVGPGIRRLQQRGGQPLPKSVRAFMEPHFGHSFHDVRIHTDAFATDLSNRIQARAFTVGRDVVLNQGEFQPTSAAGLRLLAHELTHVVQQGGNASGQPQLVQRLKNSAENPLNYTPKGKKRELGYIVYREEGPSEIHIPELSLPDIEGEPKGTKNHQIAPGKPHKGDREAVLALEKGKRFVMPVKTKRHGTAKKKFRDGVKETPENIADRVRRKILGQKQAPELENPQGKEVFYMAVQRGRGRSVSLQFLIVGTREQLVDQALVPQWDKERNRTVFDPDHAHEIQLGGKDKFDNLYLWDEDVNRSAGPAIAGNIVSKLSKLINAAKDGGYWAPGSGAGPDLKPPTLELAREGKVWKLIFDRVTGGLPVNPESKQNRYWSRKDVLAGEHIDQLSVLSETAAINLGLIGDTRPRTLHIFTGPTGGASAKLKVKDFDKNGNINEPVKDFFRGFDFDAADINLDRLRSLQKKLDPDQIPVNQASENEKIGTLTGVAFRKLESRKMIRRKEVENIPVYFSRNLGFNCYIDGERQFDKLVDGVEAVSLSPIRIEKAGIGPDGVLGVTGEILPALSLFPKDFRIPFKITGDSISVDVPIKLTNQQLGPLAVTEASLRVGADEDGFLFGGEVLFDLEGIGQGRLTANRLNLEGEFEFDWDFLSPARTKINYEGGKLSAEAEVGVKKGVLPGVESATVKLFISDDEVQFDGDLMLLAPGIPKGSTLHLSHDTATGKSRIGAEVPLTGIPGVEDGQLSFTATPKEEGGLKLKANGDAQLKFPDVDGQLILSWDDGLFVAQGFGKIARGNVEGFGLFTVTNQAIDDEGKPIEGALTDRFSALGKAAATFHFGPLTGTVGAELTRSGDLKLTDASVQAFVDLPLTRERTLFRKPRDEDKPWVLFDKHIKIPFRFKGVPLDFVGRMFVESSAEVKLLPVSLRGRAMVDFKELLLNPDGVSVPDFTARAETNDPLLAAKATAMAGGSAEIGKAELFTLGVGMTGEFSGDVAAEPTLDSEIHAKNGKLGASMSAGIALKSNLQVEVKLGIPVTVLGRFRKTFGPLEIGPFSMASPFQWEHSFQWETRGEGIDVQVAKPAGVPIFEPTENDLKKLEDAFDSSNQASEVSGKDVSADKEGGNELLQTVERVSALVEIFGRGAGIFSVIFDQFTCFAPVSVSRIAGCFTKAPERAAQLLEDAEGFYQAVNSAEDEGTLDWLEEELPGGEIAVGVLRKYLWTVEKTYEGISGVAGALGFSDPVAFEKQWAEELRRSNEGFRNAAMKRRVLMKEGFDRVSAETITALEAKSTSAVAQSFMGIEERIRASRLEAAAWKRLAGGTAAEIRKEQELLGRNFPGELAKEVAAIHRLHVVNVTGFRGYSGAVSEYESRVAGIMGLNAADEAAAKLAFAELIAEVRPVRRFHEGGPFPNVKRNGVLKQ